jgi:uncharacterized protein YqgQ
MMLQNLYFLNLMDKKLYLRCPMIGKKGAL